MLLTNVKAPGPLVCIGINLVDIEVSTALTTSHFCHGSFLTGGIGHSADLDLGLDQNLAPFGLLVWPISKISKNRH